jgi:uncharacterized protein (TIGR00369 family)
MPVPEVPPFTKLLGVNVLHRSPERTEAELTVREELCNRRGVLHGGAVMALGDTLGGMTASISLPDGGRTATIESKTNFLAAVPKGDTARAPRAHDDRAGDPHYPQRRQARRDRHADPADLRFEGVTVLCVGRGTL